MTLEYCGQICTGVEDSAFMGVSIDKCYCLDDISTAVTMSNKACGIRCPGDSAERCGGKGTLSIFGLKNETFTDVMALMGGSGGTRDKANVILNDGTICSDSDHGIPDLPEKVDNPGVTVIEDHTIVVCGGSPDGGKFIFSNQVCFKLENIPYYIFFI